MLEWLAFVLLTDGLKVTELSVDKANNRTVIERFETTSVPLKKSEKIAPQFLNDPYLAVFAQDLSSAKTLFEKRSTKSQPIASLTKIMTFLVIYENHDLDEIVEVPLVATRVDGVKIGLYQYEKITVKTLLEAILIPSGNDAAVTLAIFDSGTESAFAQKMNQKAKALGLDSATFYNSTGLDVFKPAQRCELTDLVCEPKPARDFGNNMSAKDLARLTRIALNNDFFRTTVAKSEFEGTSVDGEFFHAKKSTNQLLGTFINSKGVKTGYTFLAGECFVNLSEDEAGREILTVVLGSSNRFEETKRLMDWIWSSFVWQ